MSFENPSQETIFNYLKNAKRIAMVGLSKNPERTSYTTAQNLQKHGYQVVPVNPVYEGETILGEKVIGRLEEVEDHIDIVDIFRPSEFLAEVAESFIQVDADVYWAQLELESEEAAKILAAAGEKDVVMNRCVNIELEKMAEANEKEAE